jgi:hypothetical protein
MEEDDYCIVEYAPLNADGTRLSKEEYALARKSNEVASQGDHILKLLGEIRCAVGSFDEPRLLCRNWMTRVVKSLRRPQIFDELPEFSGVCGSCAQHVDFYNVHTIVQSDSIHWVCHSCDVRDNQDLVDLRAAVDAHLLKVQLELKELQAAGLLVLIQDLIGIRDVLKASARPHGDRFEEPRIGGHELFEWRLLMSNPLPNFPKEDPERRSFCASMTTKERAGLSRLKDCISVSFIRTSRAWYPIP